MTYENRFRENFVTQIFSAFNKFDLSSIVYRLSSIVYRPSSIVCVLAHAVDTLGESRVVKCLRLLPTFRCQKNRFFFYFTKFKSVILSSVYKRKMLKISKSGRVIQKKRIFK